MFKNVPLLALSSYVLLVFVLFAGQAYASSASAGGSSLPIGQPLQQIMSFFTGTFAYTVSVLALVGAAAGLLFGGNDLSGFIRTMLYLTCVISLLVFAVNLLGSLFSGATIPDVYLG